VFVLEVVVVVVVVGAAYFMSCIRIPIEDA
jgi:hypothetical protein